MNSREIIQRILCLAAFFVSVSLRAAGISSSFTPAIIVNTNDEPVASGKFQPTWESLKQYQTPEWFRNAKFGIWAHWGPQCEPEDGDWYARNMYLEGNGQYQDHLARYGHPSTNGFKDVIHQWKAENWNPDKLLALYKRAGAQYFFALANHHDNFDNWNSKYQPWNSVNVGPKKDLIGGWAKAARKYGLKFGVSVHAAHAWSWYEPAQGADTKGPFAGVPYDGKLTRADGKGQWWDGLDPQDLYAQDHTPSPHFLSGNSIHSRWNWDNGVSQPDAAYCQKFYNRTIDLIDKYHPDLIYFDDTALPLWPVTDAGLKIAAHFYNRNNQWHGRRSDGVLFGKILQPDQQQCMAWDIERGVSPTILAHPWQTDTCIGGWHYARKLYDRNGYKSAKTVIHMLADIVSKNGNLLLSVPVRADGTIDEKETAIVEGIADWMDVNKEAILDTRPWKILGKPETADDFRFTTKGDTLYAIELGWPTNAISMKSFGKAAGFLGKPIRRVQLLGSPEKIQWMQSDDALAIDPPAKKVSDIAIVFKITTR